MENTYRIEVKNKSIIVTGGYGYLGKAIVLALQSNGAKVWVLGRDETKFYNAFGKKQNILFLKGDVSSSESISKAFKEVLKKK